VTVKNNKYSATKYTTSNFSYGTYGSAAYAASYDSKGNLVVKVRTINNSGKTISKLKNIKVTVKNASGKTIGTYKLSSKDVSIPSGSVKDFSFTIKKSALKIKKKQDLRNAKVSAYADGYYTYTYYTYY
jgi:SLAP domain-containing protein